MKRLKFLGNKHISQAVTLLYLAVWHGIHSGYYMNFFLEFIMLISEEQVSEISYFFLLTVWLPTGRVYTYCNLFATMTGFYVFWFPTFLWLSRTCDVMDFFSQSGLKIISDHRMICYFYQVYN